MHSGCAVSCAPSPNTSWGCAPGPSGPGTTPAADPNLTLPRHRLPCLYARDRLPVTVLLCTDERWLRQCMRPRRFVAGAFFVAGPPLNPRRTPLRDGRFRRPTPRRPGAVPIRVDNPAAPERYVTQFRACRCCRVPFRGGGPCADSSVLRLCARQHGRPCDHPTRAPRSGVPGHRGRAQSSADDETPSGHTRVADRHQRALRTGLCAARRQHAAGRRHDPSRDTAGVPPRFPACFRSSPTRSA